ncbi:MAG: hypothetical protein HQM02_10870, partial [Magnetococcales bacterium]|nr:hypothetical protein [Magnetococcales bacterium]
EIALSSPSSKTFRAEIPLHLGEGESIRQVQIGNATDYKAMGVLRSKALDAVSVKVVENNGEPRILLTSNSPQAAKGFDLVLRVTSSRHTNFPVFKIPAAVATRKDPEPATQSAKAGPVGVAPPAESMPAESDVKAAAKSDGKTAQTMPAAKTPTAPTPGSRQYGPVRAGDTLTSISRGLLAKGITLHQLMAAIYERNSEQFLSGNMNNLVSGGTLKVPSVEEIRAIPDRQARILCMAHTKAWEQMQAGQPVSPPPQNVLLAAEEAAKQAPPTESAARLPVEERPAVQSQLQSVLPPGSGGSLENVLVRLQSQLGELTEVLKTNQAQQVKLESRVSTLEMSRTDGEALAKRLTNLEKIVNSVPATIPVGDGSASAVTSGFLASYSWLGGVLAVFGGLFAGWMAWIGRRWNRQAQQDGLRSLLAVTAREYPEVAREILREIDPGHAAPFIPSIHAGKLDGVPPPAGKKLVNGNVLQSVHRLNALEADRGEAK